MAGEEWRGKLCNCPPLATSSHALLPALLNIIHTADYHQLLNIIRTAGEGWRGKLCNCPPLATSSHALLPALLNINIDTAEHYQLLNIIHTAGEGWRGRPCSCPPLATSSHALLPALLNIIYTLLNIIHNAEHHIHILRNIISSSEHHTTSWTSAERHINFQTSYCILYIAEHLLNAT